MGKLVISERLDRETLLIRLQRPEKRNAINREMALGIEAGLDELDADPQLRVGVLTGTGAIFSAGTDIAEPSSPTTDRGGEYGVIRRRRQKPLIAAVEGLALGGGFEIALACDLIVAADDAEFGLPEGRIGRIATSGALFRAPRTLPRAIAVELLLGIGRLKADRAYTLGIVNRLAGPGTVVHVAHRLAQDIAASSPASVSATLQVLATIEEPVDSIGWAATAQARRELMAGADAVEGTAAFREKRRPEWTGA